MKKLFFLASILFSGLAFAAANLTVSPEVFLYKGTSKQAGSWVSMEACVTEATVRAEADPRTSGTATYTCKGEQTRVIATYTPNCAASPAPNTRTVECTAPATGSWTQTQAWTSAPYPTCWVLGEWTPAEAPSGACSTPPPPVTVTPQLLKFAETWDRNWNFEGHSVTSAFNANYGLWDYTETTYEPWLFDRASVGFYLYQMTGEERWRQKFLSDFAWYRQRIDAQGIFTPKGFGDTKYSYVTPFLHYERLTGDDQYRPIAQRIYQAWLTDFPATYSTSLALWTERELGLALEAAVSWYDLTRDPAALARANALVAQWSAVSGSVGAPLVSYTQHEGGGPGGTTPTNLTNSPWMSALYFQSARRLNAVVSTPAVLEQASRYFDWLDANGFYDAALAHPEFTGLVFPRYLTGELIGDAGYDEGNADHALDVAGFIKFAIKAKRDRGESTTRAELRLQQMLATADRSFANWTRSTLYLPKYRLSPPRKFNWWVRGEVELKASTDDTP